MILSVMLLIGITIVIGLAFFLWIKGIRRKAVMLQGKNIQLVCEDVVFEASYSDDTIYVSNYGNVEIFRMNMIVYEEGSHETRDLRDEPNAHWPGNGLDAGETFSGKINISENTEKLILVPVLRGETDDGEKDIYTCDKNYGYEIYLEG